MAREISVARPGGASHDWLIDEGLLTPDQLSKVVEAARSSGQPLRTVVDRLGLVSQRAWAKSAAAATGLATIDAAEFPKRLPMDPRLSLDYMRRNGMVILSLEGDIPWIAIADPTDGSIRQALGIVFGRKIDYVVATERDIEDALQRCAEDVGEDEDEVGGRIARCATIGRCCE